MKYDVIIVGAGPAGTTCASLLGRKNKKVLLVDKAQFPRDKICGDGVFNKGFSVLKKLGIYEDFQKLENKQISGTLITVLNKKTILNSVDINYEKSHPFAYICKREIFDNFLLNNAKKHCDFIESFTATNLIKENNKVIGITGKNKNGQIEEYKANIVVGADGAYGIVAKQLDASNFNDDSYAVALRAYYRNIKGLKNHVELHYLKELVPGYFWIFPTGNNCANVGLGMRCENLKKSNINLKLFLNEILQSNEHLKHKFKNAKLESKILGSPLTLASQQIPITFDGALLIGEAAQLVDPLTGEGIANALISGEIASKTIIQSLEQKNYSKQFLCKYEKQLRSVLNEEFKKSLKYRKILMCPFLFKNIILLLKYSKTLQKLFLNKVFPNYTPQQGLSGEE